MKMGSKRTTQFVFPHTTGYFYCDVSKNFKQIFSKLQQNILKNAQQWKEQLHLLLQIYFWIWLLFPCYYTVAYFYCFKKDRLSHISELCFGCILVRLHLWWQILIAMLFLRFTKITLQTTLIAFFLLLLLWRCSYWSHKTHLQLLTSEDLSQTYETLWLFRAKRLNLVL